ncbi:MAG TPA: carboxypeptidase regulatory-like domain-containing protein [Chitinophagaceae bacterium]|nr:carboxypeptidase regulatory-like domain-containing protein [Chitinophagaceae bacterium]
MKNQSFAFKCAVLCIFVFSALYSNSQVTTATLSGIVADKKGTVIAGATVSIEYPDAGIKQTLTTKADGRYTVPNLRVGGPYRITVNHVSYKDEVTEGVILELGLNNTVDFALEEKTTELDNVTVTATSRIFDSKRTGASTNINNRLIKALPTISRSADDYLRLTPSAAANYNGMSFMGRNGQYNNYSLDGAVFNNPFGLDAPTPGGQTNAQPISLDAIDQIQINLAPYDVTQAGFTGAGVNTVTKSGNNNFTGTAYVFYRTEELTGNEIEKTKLVVPDLRQLQTGFTVGGALKKNKLFYFLSFETEQRTDEASSYVALSNSTTGESNASRVLESDLQAVSNILKTRFAYETGPYQGFTHDQTNYKWLAKLDWNISDVHKLSFTYNGLDAQKDKPAHPSAIGRRGPDYYTLQYQNSGYEIVNKLQSFGAELRSNFKSGNANKLRVVYTTFRDKRNPFSDPFPVINIAKNGVRYIVAGHEPFSIHNRLDQDAFQVTNDFHLYKKNHDLTFGASFESFKFGNSFNLVGYGPTLFWDGDIQHFKDSVPVGGQYVFGAYPLDVDVNAAKAAAAADQWTWYYLTVGQAAAYIQDEWQPSSKFKLTYGIRMDMPVYFEDKFRYVSPDGKESSPTVPNNDPLTLFDKDGNPITNGVGKDLDNTQLPTKSPLISPRVGFNWDVRGDKTFQVRGGSGLFTGRFPFVWLGNHIGNPFSFFYNATDKDFKWPQVWRTNVGTDFKVRSAIFTIDVAYTKDVKAMMVRNYKLGTPTGVLNSGIGDKRSIYLPSDQGTANTYVFTNTDEGYQFNLSLQAQKTFPKGLFLMGAYNYNVAKDASSISAEISSDAFDRNPILNNANKAINSNSLYGNRHRFLLAGSKKFDYGEDNMWGTTISIFSSWTSGNRFAYVYAGDINNDGTASNDLIYVPTNAEIDAMTFAPLTDINGNVQSAEIQRQTLKNFIAQDDYLSRLRGQYTEKYGGETPWYSQLDLRILQDLNFNAGKQKNTLQLSIDIINLGNLFNSEWGIRKYATTSGYFQPIGVSYNNNSPVYTFDPTQYSTFVSSPDLPSRWQMQLGLRYIF